MNTVRSLLAAAVVTGLLVGSLPCAAAAKRDNAAGAYVVAVLPFTHSGKELADIGADVPAILAAQLSSDAGMLLVDRADVDRTLSEMELSVSGVVDPGSAVEIGHMTGAQLLVTGRVFPAHRELVIVAKIIGVETGRVYGRIVSLPFSGSLVEAVSALAEDVRADIVANGDTLVARHAPEEDLVTKLKRSVGDTSPLPSVTVAVAERSLQRPILDPAVETEIAYLLTQIGFTVLDPATTTQSPDIEITGEAFSELGTRNGNLVSSKGRVEIKAVDRATGRIVFVDRAVTVAVDLSPEIAGKTALARGAARLTERLVPALVDLQ